MNKLGSTKENLHNEDYNEEPVVYCRHCLSLKVMALNDNMDYCDICGCTDIDSTDIVSWEKMYEEKYGKPFNIK